MKLADVVLPVHWGLTLAANQKSSRALSLLSRGSFVFGPRVVAPCPALHNRIFLNFNMQASLLCIISAAGKAKPAEMLDFVGDHLS